MKAKLYLITVVILVSTIAALVAVNYVSKKTPPEISKAQTKKEIKVANKTMISVKDSEDLKLMEERKKEYGIDQGLDMVLKSDESAEINGQVIDLKSIEEKDLILKGDVISNDLKINEKTKPKDYGIYIVKKGDNLWDIHFRLLKELFKNKGISLSESADEPINDGYSSGVGKILKFSEETVSIYSLKTGEITYDINTLEPEGRVIIYKMTEIAELLNDISLNNINNVVFDGKNLWIDSVN
ncbi:MAG: hypothetical protein H6680_06720 [Desulfobacteraceae bacterium]|nr:hypothetical protein [Desulfobacteraceae bacterium]